MRSPSLTYVRIALIGLLVLALPVLHVMAQAGTPITTTLPTGPTPNDPIVPKKTPATPTPDIPYAPKLEVVHFYTDPQQIRAREPFVLYVEIKNFGAAPAVNWSLSAPNCGVNGFVVEGNCNRLLSITNPGDSVTISLNLRYLPPVETDVNKSQKILLKLDDGIPPETENFELFIYVLEARNIPTETVTSVYQPFQRPKLVVQRTWVAKARARVEELLTAVPLVISATLPPGYAGGPEFEVVVELQNQGAEPAHNIYIDFCQTGTIFAPVYAGCRKAVPTTLKPGESAIASQTMAVQQGQLANAHRGAKMTVKFSYEFRSGTDWLREELTDTVYLYPQPFPAITPIPPLIVDEHQLITPDLVVNTPQLNVRYGPGTNYPVVGVLYQGMSLPVKGSYGAWWQIEFQGTIAWVHGDFVIVRGAEKVTPVPVAQIPAAPAPTPPIAPPRDPVGLREPQPTTYPAVLLPSPSPAPPVAALPLVNGSSVQEQPFLLVNNRSIVQGDGRSEPLGAAPIIVIERYQTLPEQPQLGEPFLLELVLRNASTMPARQLLLSWQSTELIPIGAGTIRSLPDLAAGAIATVQAHFVLTDRPSAALIPLPIQIAYADPTGQLVAYNEQLTFVRQAGGAAIVKPVTLALSPPSADRPLWQRVLFGLVGLGAE